MQKTVMPINMAIGILQKIMPCIADENDNTDYKETTVTGEIDAKQIKGFNKFNIDPAATLTSAAINELNYTIISNYINDIKTFGEHTKEANKCIFSESLSYNINHAFEILESLHKDNMTDPVIFMTSDKCREIMNDPDFIPNENIKTFNPIAEVNLYGMYKGVDVFQVMCQSDSFVTVCYNKDYTLHYHPNSLMNEQFENEQGELIYKVSFSNIFINENAESNYLTIH